jgi:outer membrane protein TolC
MAAARRAATQTQPWRAVRLLACLAIAGAGAAARAQQTPTERGGGPLACEEAVLRVLAQYDTSPGGGTAPSSVARWLAPPEVRVRSNLGTLNQQSRLGVRMPVPVPGVPSARAKADGARAAHAAAAVQATRARLAADVRTEYATARRARRQREVDERVARAARERASALARLTASGGATALDRETAALQAAAADDAVERARREEQSALEVIQARTGAPPELGNGTCATTPPTTADDTLPQNPEVRMAHEDVAAAEAEALLSQRRRWVWPSFVEMSWVHEEARQQDGVLFQAGVEVPFPSGGASAPEVRRQELDLERRVTEERVRAEVERARARYEDARAALRHLEAEAPRLAGARDLAAQADRAGAAPEEIWNLEREIAAWERRTIEGEYDAAIAAIEWRLALGLP